MNSKVARLAEHQHTMMIQNINVASGHGMLSSNCCKCKGFMDFVRIHDTYQSRTVLRCRKCKHEINLD